MCWFLRLLPVNHTFMIKYCVLKAQKRKIFVAVKKHTFDDHLYHKVNGLTGSAVKN